MKIKTTFRGGGGDDGEGWDRPSNYQHVYPRIKLNPVQASPQDLFSDTDSWTQNDAPSPAGMRPTKPWQGHPLRFTKERNQAMDKEYGTHPDSPLHTNQRFPDQQQMW